ncbi:ATP-binding protein [Rhodococcus sp. ARC_M6]|uniref:ATP-binding protein n=1 Tax=Rhodococcus sp. ARC_M6 TaxID=2928852 RepID=UPI001FB4DCA9|nr:ATP-binding protein [Rhodococcus sp. ARC_M6]MCJ0904773.1 ATP-binding protein [Rhodococcus sp. ARC_M6]
MIIDESTSSAVLSVAASPEQLRVLRAYVRAVATHRGLAADDLADLVLAVDEAASTLLDHTNPLSVLTCAFDVDPGNRLRVHLTATTTEPIDHSATSFGWFVLHTLVDAVTVEHIRTPHELERWDVAIILTKALHAKA